MNAREIILNDCIEVSKGNPSPLKKNKKLAIGYSNLVDLRFFSFLAVPTYLYLSITKAHTGRTVYRNIFLLSLLSSYVFHCAVITQRNRLMTDFDCKEEDFAQNIFFYKNALLDV